MVAQVATVRGAVARMAANRGTVTKEAATREASEKVAASRVVVGGGGGGGIGWKWRQQWRGHRWTDGHTVCGQCRIVHANRSRECRTR